MGNAVVTETSSVFPDVVGALTCPCRETCLWYCSQKLTEGTNRVNADKHERPSIFPPLPLPFSLTLFSCVTPFTFALSWHANRKIRAWKSDTLQLEFSIRSRKSRICMAQGLLAQSLRHDFLSCSPPLFLNLALPYPTPPCSTMNRYLTPTFVNAGPALEFLRIHQNLNISNHPTMQYCGW